MSLTFYFAPQSNASRIHWALEELGVPYEKVQLDLRAGDQRKPDFLALNPNGKVPTLVLDGTPMFESIAIQIALGERFGVDKGLWPQLGSPEHLQALTWLIWGQVSLGGAMFRYMENTSDYIPAERHNPKTAEHAMGELRDLLAMLDARLATRPYITGDNFTLVDLDLSSVLGWGLHVCKVELAAFTHLQAWLARATARPAAARVS